MTHVKLLPFFLLAFGTACIPPFNPDLSGIETSGGSLGTETEEATTEAGETVGGDGDGDTGETDTGSPEPFCGDQETNENEDCDGDVGDLLCADFEFYGGGELGCTEDCKIDTSDCLDLVYTQEFLTEEWPTEFELVVDMGPQAQIMLGSDTLLAMMSGGCLDDPSGYCAQLGPMGHNLATGFKLSLEFFAVGEARFWFAGWTETDKDFFEFQLDGNTFCKTSGNFLVWQECVVPDISAGTHELSWWYTKDASVTSGYDAVWIDHIEVTNAAVSP